MRTILLLVLCLRPLCAAESTPSPALVVLNKGDNAMAIVNPASGKVVATIAAGRNPHEAAVSDDGKLAFASNMQGNSISVIDLVAQKELHRVDVPNPKNAARPAFCWREVILYCRREQCHCAVRSGNQSNRLDARLRPERYSHARDDRNASAGRKHSRFTEVDRQEPEFTSAASCRRS